MACDHSLLTNNYGKCTLKGVSGTSLGINASGVVLLMDTTVHAY